MIMGNVATPRGSTDSTKTEEEVVEAGGGSSEGLDFPILKNLERLEKAVERCCVLG